MNYLEKYLKYKRKYLDLKKSLSGGNGEHPSRDDLKIVLHGLEMDRAEDRVANVVHFIKKFPKTK